MKSELNGRTNKISEEKERRSTGWTRRANIPATTSCIFVRGRDRERRKGIHGEQCMHINTEVCVVYMCFV